MYDRIAVDDLTFMMIIAKTIRHNRKYGHFDYHILSNEITDLFYGLNFVILVDDTKFEYTY